MDRRAFIKGAVIAASAPASIGIVAYDPLVTTIRQYRAGMAAFDAIPDDYLTPQEEEELTQATYGPAQDLLMRNVLPTTSLAGVREALRLALDEHGFCCSIAENAVRSALTYLEAHSPSNFDAVLSPA